MRSIWADTCRYNWPSPEWRCIGHGHQHVESLRALSVAGRHNSSFAPIALTLAAESAASHRRRQGKAKAWPGRMQDPRGDDFSAPKLHKKKVVYRPQPSGQLKGEPELLRREVPQSSSMVQKPPKRSLKVEPHTSPSDRGTPDSMTESEYRELRRKYLMLEEENIALDKELSMEDEEIKALEEEKLALLDQLVVLEGLVEPSELQSRRRP